MNCPSCGADLQESARFCGSCGQVFRDTRAPDVGGSSTKQSAAPVRSSAGLGTSELLSTTWAASMPSLGILILGSLALGFASLFAVITLFGIFALPALGGGMVVVALRVVAGQHVVLGDFFKGMRLFVPMLLLGIVTAFLTQIGYYLFVIPGVYLTIVWSLAPYVMVDRGLEFWPSMEMSREAVHAHLGEVVVFTIAAIAINCVAMFVTAGLALVVTMPVTAVGFAVLYDRLIGIEGGADKL